MKNVVINFTGNYLATFTLNYWKTKWKILLEKLKEVTAAKLHPLNKPVPSFIVDSPSKLDKGTVSKGTVMQIEKSLINDRLCVSKVSWTFHIPIIYDLGLIYQWNFLFS